jgi:prevent-host-death family protein
MGARVSIKQLHQTTGELVRRASTSSSAIEITDRGKPVAVLTRAALLRPQRRRRTLLPEYEALLARKSRGSVLDDLEAIRGDR